MPIAHPRIAALALAGLLTTAGLARAADPGVTDTEIKIGASSALTGPGALVGIAQMLGEKVAAGEVNEAGGINGRRIVQDFQDDSYVPAKTVQVVHRLLDVDHVFAITASSGTASTMAALPLTEGKGVPMLQTAAPNTVMFTPMHKNLFVVGVPYGPGTYEVVKAMAARKPDAKWLAVVQDDEFGDDVQSGYERALKDLGKSSLAVLRYKRGQVDFSAEILKAKQLGATVIISGGIINENVAMAKELRRTGLEAQLVINWSARLPQTLDLMGEPGNGVIAADYVGDFNDAAGERFMTLARKYLSADEIKQLNRTSLTGYVGYRFLFDAIGRCGKDVTQACVIEKMETTQNLNVDGIMSPISFTPTTRLAPQTLRYFIDDYASRQWKALPAQ